MKNRLLQKPSLAALACVLLLLTLLAAHAQTYTWADNAQGQPYEVCPSGLGPMTNYYPSNNLWTQSVQTNGNCNNTGTVISQPSNWDPALPVGIYPGGPGALGVSVILGPPANTFLGAGGHLNLGNLTIQADGSLGIGGNWSIVLDNLEFQGDGEITSGSGGFLIRPGGTIIKSGGAGSFSILNPTFDGTNNIFEVDSGTLIFPSGFGAAQVNGGTFIVSNNATLLLTADSGGDPVLNGDITGIGDGTVLINNGAPSSDGCDLNFPGAMLQWTNGTLKGGPWTNSGVLNISSVGPQFYGALTFYNDNLVNLADNSSLDFFHTGGAAPALYNELGGTFNIQGDSSLTTGDGTIYNYGLFIKSAGAGISQITPIFDNYGGTVEVDSGTMLINLTGGGYVSNANFVVSNGAMLSFLTNNYNMEIEGALTGSGGGTVLMDNGTVSSDYQATLNFPGSMFQWAGGKLGGYTYSGYLPITNLGTINISGPVAITGSIANSGAIIQSGAGSVGTGGALFNNPGAVYDIQNDGNVSTTLINNYGLLEKTSGTNESIFAGTYNNFGPNAVVEADTGTLAFGGASLFTNTSFVVSNGATVALSISNNVTTDIEGVLTGSGGGTVLMSNGIISSSYQATLDFPGAMFQCQGGTLGNTTVVLNNIGTVNVSGPVALNSYAYMANNGTMIQSGNGSLGRGVGLNNNVGGVYDLQNDGTISSSTFNNYGLLEKTSGTNASLITANFNNWGAIEAPGGTIIFTNGTFTQNAGTLQLSSAISLQSSIQENGGIITGVGAMGNPGGVSMTLSGGALAPGNPFGTLSFLGHYGFSMSSGAAFNVVLGGSNQFSQLTVPNSSATVAGTLNVTLANGYAPTVGTQFQIVSTGSRGGAFSALNVPPGISVTYSNIGVFLTVTSAVPPDISMPAIVNTNFTFSVGTLSNQNYTIEQNTDLSTTNWTAVTNFTGNGSVFQFITPVTNIPALFFRVVEP